MIFLILSRYVFGWSVVGVLEVIMIFGIWLYMTGSLIASKRDEHLVVDLLSLSLKSGKARVIHQVIVYSITTIICAFFIFWSYKMLAWGLKRPQVTPGLSISLLVPQASIMVCAVGTFIYSIRNILINIKTIRSLG
ncbi:TRAP transporter small permease [Amphritea sp.]|uniref:TRAP transporter small permease n=1 Tax=Amphritea sp. TaxID=1872502 RepID=UPI003A919866